MPPDRGDVTGDQPLGHAARSDGAGSPRQLGAAGAAPAAPATPAIPAALAIPAAETDFLALADPTRRWMLERLADGPATITALHAGLAGPAGLSGPPITRQAASKHLRVLAEAGLVTDQKVGRERRYSLAPGALTVATGWLTAIEERWNRRIAALKRLVEEE